MKDEPTQELPYELFLTRTFSVLGTSLWEYWYQSDQFLSLTGFLCTDTQFFGTKAHGGEAKQEYLVRCYRNKEQVTRMNETIRRKLLEKPEDALLLIESAFDLYNSELRKIENRSADPEAHKNALLLEYQSLEEVFSMYVTVGIFTGLLPFLWLGVVPVEHTQTTQRIQELCEELRKVTLYPQFFEHVVLPYLEAKTGVPREDLNMLTFNEIRALYQTEDSVALFQSAIAKRKEAMHTPYFIYTVRDGVAVLEFPKKEEFEEKLKVVDPSALADSSPEGLRVLRGVVVSLGDGKPVTGIARVVTGTDLSQVEFNEGDILVTINSSPIYMPLIRKASALLSEEGGMACHTAIVAREGARLVKPTMMGIPHLLTKIPNGAQITVNTKNAVILY